MSPVEVERSEDGRLSGRWAVKREEGGTGWVEITSLLLGEPGRMRAMPPSLRIKTVGPVLTPHEHIMVCASFPLHLLLAVSCPSWSLPGLLDLLRWTWLSHHNCRKGHSGLRLLRQRCFMSPYPVEKRHH